MRKAFFNLLIIGLFLGGIFQQVHAQDTKQDVNLNIGGLTNQSFMGPIFTLGAGADFHLGKHVMISPELQLWSSELRLDILQLNLGATLNYKLKIFFVGGGVNIPILQTATETDVFGLISFITNSKRHGSLSLSKFSKRNGFSRKNFITFNCFLS